jgi:uncharacterized membrane protein
MTGSEWSDRRVESIVGNLLRVGVILAGCVVLAGGVIFLVRHGTEPAHYRVFLGEPSDLRSLHGIVHGALALRGRAIIQLGLLLLIATPITRVAFAMFGFAEEKDWTYVLFTGIVLVILLYSLVGTA